jgi:hypothetical protein
MTTYSLTEGGTTKLGEIDAGRHFVLKKRLDLAALADSENAGVAFGAADVLKLFNIPAMTLVSLVSLEVVKAEGAALTADVGDGDDPDGFLDGVSLNATAGTAYHTGAVHTDTVTVITTANGAKLGKLYTAADTLDLTLVDAGANAAVINVCAVCMDLSSE